VLLHLPLSVFRCHPERSERTPVLALAFAVACSTSRNFANFANFASRL